MQDIKMKSKLDDIEPGVRNGGRCMNNQRYADYTTMLIESKEDLMKPLHRVKKGSEKADLNLNQKRTKILSTEKIEVFRLEDNYV